MNEPFQLEAEAAPAPVPVIPHVFMDELTPCVPNRQWKWDRSCHLFADLGHLEELHAVARRLGLKRAWFQPKPGKLPHYDLHPAKAERAAKLGVRTVDRWTMVEHLRRWRDSARS